jgi:hypothetical protein
MNLEITRLRDRPRNRWEDEMREDVRMVGGEGWQEKVYKVSSKKGRTFAIKALLLILSTPNQSSPLYWRYTVPNISSIVGMLSVMARSSHRIFLNLFHG